MQLIDALLWLVTLIAQTLVTLLAMAVIGIGMCMVLLASSGIYNVIRRRAKRKAIL